MVLADPYFELVFGDDGNIVDIEETERPPAPPEPPTNAELAAAKIFVYQIKIGKMTIDDVPEHWKEQVKKKLLEAGEN